MRPFLRSAGTAIGRSTPPQRAGAVIATMIAVALVLHLLNPWARAVMLFGDVISMESDIRPLTWVTAGPERGSIEWVDGGRGEWITPSGVRQVPALVLALGARPAGPDDPRVLRITDALARTGFAVLLPISDGLNHGEVSPHEVDRLVQAVIAADDHPRTRAGSTLLVGLSVGGSLSLLAAADGRLEGRIAAVLAFGPYHEAGSIIAGVASHSVRTLDGTVREWTPNSTTRWVLAASLRTVPVEDDDPAAEAIATLLAGIEDEPLSPEDASAAVERLRASQSEWLEGISPAGRLHALRAPWILIHDLGDDLIPYEESERIAQEREPDLDLRIEIFDHVTPDLGNLWTLLRDGTRLIDAFARLIAASR